MSISLKSRRAQNVAIGDFPVQRLPAGPVEPAFPEWVPYSRRRTDVNGGLGREGDPSAVGTAGMWWEAPSSQWVDDKPKAG